MSAINRRFVVATNRGGEKGGHWRVLFVRCKLNSLLLSGDSNGPLQFYSIDKFIVIISGLAGPNNRYECLKQ